VDTSLLHVQSDLRLASDAGVCAQGLDTQPSLAMATATAMAAAMATAMATATTSHS
jgi:hypothetical protein